LDTKPIWTLRWLPTSSVIATVFIINLENRSRHFQDAMKVAKLSANRGTILMVGTKRRAHWCRYRGAAGGVPFVDQRWLGGMLTNFKTVKTSIKRLKEMKATRSGS
jgi:small subunit ribosomal protein S2